MGALAPIVVLPRWFPEKPGLAYSLALVGFGLGTVVNVPLISFLLSATGGPFRTFAVLGLFYAVLVGGAAWFVRHPSGDLGYGRRPPRVPEAVDEDRWQGRDNETEGGSYDLGGALRTWQWYAIWVMFLEHHRGARGLLRRQGHGRVDRRGHHRRPPRLSLPPFPGWYRPAGCGGPAPPHVEHTLEHP